MTNELLIVTNVISREITGLDVVNSVSGFYSAAFDKLFQLVLALGVLFGVILPILIQFYQRRTVRAELAKQLEEKKTELLADIDKKFNAEKENISTSLKQNIATIEKRQNKAEGAVFRLQALNRTANDSLETCHDLCMAAEFF
jgi:Tfp pilus assembly protein PilN